MIVRPVQPDWTVQKVADEGSSSPFMARLMIVACCACAIPRTEIRRYVDGIGRGGDVPELLAALKTRRITSG